MDIEAAVHFDVLLLPVGGLVDVELIEVADQRGLVGGGRQQFDGQHGAELG
ncbi:hypothetical protein D3C77_777540 [compost metagenome]